MLPSRRVDENDSGARRGEMGHMFRLETMLICSMEVKLEEAVLSSGVMISRTVVKNQRREHHAHLVRRLYSMFCKSSIIISQFVSPSNLSTLFHLPKFQL